MSPEKSLPLRSPSAARRSCLRPSLPRKALVSSEPIDILPKCSSEPVLPGGLDASPSSASGGWLYRQMTYNDLSSPCSPLLSPERLQSPREAYQKDTKVVVTVTMEGSTGPIRTMVKLGSSVDETIKLVIERYGKEGRNPPMDQNAASIYELHLSYFSLESLDRSASIGDSGSRNFYLRKGKSSGILKSTTSTSEVGFVGSHGPHPPFPSMTFFPSYVTRKVAKVARRMRKLWKVLGCLHCSS